MFHQLKTFEFRGTPHGPHLLITGGVHGDEFEPISAIRQLVNAFALDSPIVAGLSGQVTLVPIVNEAAFLRGHRCAEDELDLARTCPGRADGSITEQTAWALSELIRAADFYIDLHTGGTEFSVFPLSGYVLHSDPNVLDVQRQMARAFNLPLVWGTAPNLEGRSLSVARDANVPAIYCEYLGAATCHSEGVAAYVDGCLNVMSALKMLDLPAPASQVLHVIEDPTPSSGHVQVCNPSPVTGFFEPAVTLGEQVSSGQHIGAVYELPGFQEHKITADRDGLVITLRTFPRVRQGESLGVIVKTS